MYEAHSQGHLSFVTVYLIQSMFHNCLVGLKPLLEALGAHEWRGADQLAWLVIYPKKDGGEMELQGTNWTVFIHVWCLTMENSILDLGVGEAKKTNDSVTLSTSLQAAM